MTVYVEDYIPVIKYEGFNTAKDVSFEGATTGIRASYETISADDTLTAAESGKVIVEAAGAGTTTYTLPATVAGLTYTFVCGDAAGEINISPNASDKIQGKGITAADDKDLINTGATNAVGDSVTLVGDGVDGWWITNIIGTWAREA